MSLACAFVFSVALGAAPSCDRTCMTVLVDQYLAAVVKHDPSGLPLSPGVRFTENTAEIKIGDGLWVSASEAPTTFKVYAVDPATSQVAFYGVMKELDKPLIIALRLKVIHGQITEIEHVLARNMRPDRMQNLITPRPGLLADVSDSDKTSREEMLTAADSYFEAIEHGKAPAVSGRGRTERPGVRVPDVQPSRRCALDQDPGCAGRGRYSDGRRHLEPAGWGNLQDPGRQDSRDRSYGGLASLRHEKRLGVDKQTC